MEAATLGALLTAVLTLVALLVKRYAARREEKEDHQDESNIQDFREKLADGNSDALDAAAATQHDLVQRTLRGDSGRGDDHGQKIDP